jgi:HlyD family secretion protein
MSKSKTSRSTRFWWILTAVAVVGVAIYFVGLPALSQAQTRSSEQPAQTVTAFVGDVYTSISASGKVTATRDAQLAMDIQGKVARVMVEEGQRVAAGEALVQLEVDAWERAVATAEQNLIIQQASLEELRAGAGQADVLAAQANLESARANLERVRAGAEPADIAAAQVSLEAARMTYQTLLDAPDENALAQARARLLSAEATLQQAQAEYDQVSWRTDIGALPQSTRLQQATIDYEAALAAYNDVAAGATADQLAQAQASVAQAEANLERVLDSPTAAEVASATAQFEQAQTALTNLLDGATAERLAIAEAQVTLARISLEDARDKLAKATLVAPFEGVVTAVHISEGEFTSGPVIELADMDHLEIVLSVDEVDLGALDVGQPAIVTLTARPDVELESQIIAIAPRAALTMEAIVRYDVRLTLVEPDPFIRIGMTVDAELITARAEQVLLAPNSAISADRQAGVYAVHLARSGANGMEIQRVEVTIGLRDAEYTQITRGIAEGDRLLASALPLEQPAEEGNMLFNAPREQLQQLRAQ